MHYNNLVAGLFVADRLICRWTNKLQEHRSKELFSKFIQVIRHLLAHIPMQPCANWLYTHMCWNKNTLSSAVDIWKNVANDIDRNAEKRKNENITTEFVAGDLFGMASTKLSPTLCQGLEIMLAFHFAHATYAHTYAQFSRQIEA